MYKSRVGLSASVTSYFTLAVRLGGLAPTLSLDFLSGSLDSRITFSRGSNATLVDSTGKVTYAPNNQATYSQQFDIAWTQTSVTVSANSTSAPDGTTTADTVTASAATSAHRIFSAATTIPAGLNVIHSIYVKAGTHNFVQIHDGASGLYYANFNLSTGVVGTTANCTAAITALSGGWYRCSMAFANLAANPLLALGLVTSASAARNESWTAAGTESVYLWGAQIETVTYQTTPSTYNATTASAYYGPRFDYDPVTLNPKGLLIEEQRSNLLTYSEQFDNAAWTKTNITTTANAISAPDGTTTADKIEATTTAATNFFTTSTAITVTGTSATYSVYVKQGNGATKANSFLLRNLTTATNLVGIIFNYSTGTFTYSVGSTGASAVDVGNGWWRLQITATTGITSGDAMRVYAGFTSGAATAGDFLYAWGAQVEAGAFATSYIPTVASTVTRSADVATMTGTNFSSWYNQSEGTMVCNFVMEGLAPSGTADVWAVSDGTSSNITRMRQGIVIAGADVTMVTSGATQVDSNSIAVPVNILTKSAFAWSTTSSNLTSNGASSGDGGANTPPSVNRLVLTGSNKWLRQLAFYPTRLANATLQRLTA